MLDCSSASGLRLPWFRTVFTNLGDVISPETLPPLELESVPVDVGELITDQLSHFWFSSLLRNLADRLVPEKLPALELTSKPVANVIPETWILLPAWSEVISTPKVFYPDKPKAASTAVPLPAFNPAVVAIAEVQAAPLQRPNRSRPASRSAAVAHSTAHLDRHGGSAGDLPGCDRVLAALELGVAHL